MGFSGCSCLTRSPSIQYPLPLQEHGHQLIVVLQISTSTRIRVCDYHASTCMHLQQCATTSARTQVLAAQNLPSAAEFHPLVNDSTSKYTQPIHFNNCHLVLIEGCWSSTKYFHCICTRYFVIPWNLCREGITYIWKTYILAKYWVYHFFLQLN